MHLCVEFRHREKSLRKALSNFFSILDASFALNGWAASAQQNGLMLEGEPGKSVRSRLPKEVQARIKLVSDWNKEDVAFDAVLHHGDSDQLRGICEQIAKRPGAIVGVHGLSSGETAVALERLVIERALSVNTAAAGGNASLMTIG